MKLLQEVKALDELVADALENNTIRDLVSEREGGAWERIKQMRRANKTAKERGDPAGDKFDWEMSKAKEWGFVPDKDAGSPEISTGKFRDALKEKYITIVRGISKDDKKAYAKAEKVVDEMFDEHEIEDANLLKKMTREIEVKQKTKGMSPGMARLAGELEDEGGIFGPGFGSWRPGMGMDPDETLKFPDNWEEILDQKYKDLEAKKIKRKLAKEKSDRDQEGIPDEGTKKPSEPGEEKPGVDGKGLKSLPKSEVNLALNFLRKKGPGPGLNAANIKKLVDDEIARIQKGLAGSDKEKFATKQLPTINQVKDELVKILSGDLSNLVKESIKVHPITRAVISELARR